MNLTDTYHGDEDRTAAEVPEKSAGEVSGLLFDAGGYSDAKTAHDASTTKPPENLVETPSDTLATGDAMSEDGGGFVEQGEQEPAPPSAASISIDDNPLTIPEALVDSIAKCNIWVE